MPSCNDTGGLALLTSLMICDVFVTVCCTDANTHNPGDSPIVGHVTRADVDLQPKHVGECRYVQLRI